jgi:hypothetical protein
LAVEGDTAEAERTMRLSWLVRVRRALQKLAGRRDAATNPAQQRGEALAFAWDGLRSEPPFPGPIDVVDVSGAELRARNLLVRMLTSAQRAEFERREAFTVEVPGRGRFAILPRRTLNVLDMESGECYCCVTVTDVPLFDLMLTQKLLLEHDPEKFFAAANCPSEFLFGPSPRSMRRQRGGAPARVSASSLSALPYADRTL